MKKITVDRCCRCGFNEHGGEIVIPIMRSYLGYNFMTFHGTIFGGPTLYCMYDPKYDFRENMRRVTHGHAKPVFYIWSSLTSDDEFENQLTGFPKRCPLEDSK